MEGLRVLVFAILFLAIDVTYVTLSRSYYEGAARNVSSRGFPSGRVIDAVVAYALLLSGFLLMVPPLARDLGSKIPFSDRVAYGLAGAVFGAVVYGVFNATNRVLFEKWTLEVSLRDTMWGTLAGSFLGTFYFWLNTMRRERMRPVGKS